MNLLLRSLYAFAVAVAICFCHECTVAAKITPSSNDNRSYSSYALTAARPVKRRKRRMGTSEFNHQQQLQQEHGRSLEQKMALHLYENKEEHDAQTCRRVVHTVRGGWLPAGYNPFGYRITDLGQKFLEFEGSLDGDVGRFLASMKSGSRKSTKTIKEQWLEIVRVSKKGQSLRIYRLLDELIEFCVKAGFLN